MADVADVAVISANVGGYDAPPDQPWVEYLDVPLNGEHPRLAAKRPKMLNIRPDGDPKIVVWVDANMQVVPDIGEQLAPLVGDAPLALWPHPDRADIHAEAEASLILAPEKYWNQCVMKQVRTYYLDGYQDELGLYATGVLVWNLDHPKTEELASLWLGHNQRWSYQDQLSLPYVLWLLEVKPALLPHDLRSNPWVRIGAHLSNR